MQFWFRWSSGLTFRSGFLRLGLVNANTELPEHGGALLAAAANRPNRSTKARMLRAAGERPCTQSFSLEDP